MWQTPKTRPSVLVRMQNRSDQEAWQIFESIYRPAIYRSARIAGLQDADANDVAQTVLTNLSRQPWTFEPDDQRGQFRTWLAKVTQNAIIDLRRSQPKDVTQLQRMDIEADPGKLDRQLDQEYHREVFAWAVRVIQPEFSEDAWSCFWQTAVDGVSIESVAVELNRSVGSVYTSRSRIMRRLRQQIHLFDDRMDQQL